MYNLMCSIGPQIKTEEDIASFIEAGMSIARFNFSHVDYEKFEYLLEYMKNNHPDVIRFQDLQGRKIRVSKKFINPKKVSEGNYVIFCTERYYAKNKNCEYTLIPIDYSIFDAFANCSKVLMKDGTMEFDVIEKSQNYILTKTVKGGIIRAEKGLNFPKMCRKNITLSDKDKHDIVWGVKREVDVICVSYVSKAQDILEVKELLSMLKKHLKGCKSPKIWAKIECQEALDNFDEILKVSDGILIGRGDLSAEIDIADIPLYQEKIISKMKKTKKPLVIGTYVLENMKYNTKPTVPEVNDIYNFMKSKVNGFLLAGESSTSKYALKNVKYMKELMDKYEKEIVGK